MKDIPTGITLGNKDTDLEMAAFIEATTEESFPLRNILIKMWKKSWCGLLEKKLTTIRFFPSKKSGKAVGLYF